MSNSQIKISELESVIMDALDEYKDKASDVIKDTLPKIGRQAVQTLKQTSPGKGEYAKSWTYTMRKSRGSKYENDLVIHNKKHYRIVHLLEKEHALRNGGRYYPEQSGTVHVNPVQERAEEDAITQIKDKLENLGV